MAQLRVIPRNVIDVEEKSVLFLQNILQEDNNFRLIPLASFLHMNIIRAYCIRMGFMDGDLIEFEFIPGYTYIWSDELEQCVLLPGITIDYTRIPLRTPLNGYNELFARVSQFIIPKDAISEVMKTENTIEFTYMDEIVIINKDMNDEDPEPLHEQHFRELLNEAEHEIYLRAQINNGEWKFYMID